MIKWLKRRKEQKIKEQQYLEVLERRNAVIKDFNQRLAEGAVVYAFTVGEVDYYRFDNLANLPIGKFRMSQHLLDRLETKMSLAYINTFIEGMDEALNKGKLTKAAEYLANMKERVGFVSDPYLFLMFCSIIFFSKDENIYHWDEATARVKVDHWLKNGAQDFFLSNNITDMLPFVNLYNVGLLDYMKGQSLISLANLMGLKSLNSSKANSSEAMQNLSAEMDFLQSFTQSISLE